MKIVNFIELTPCLEMTEKYQSIDECQDEYVKTVSKTKYEKGGGGVMITQT